MDDAKKNFDNLEQKLVSGQDEFSDEDSYVDEDMNSEVNTTRLNEFTNEEFEEAHEKIVGEYSEKDKNLEAEFNNIRQQYEKNDRDEKKYKNIEDLHQECKADLSSLLANSMPAKRQELEEQQYKGWKKLLKYVGYKAEAPSDETVLEHVLDDIINDKKIAKRKAYNDYLEREEKKNKLTKEYHDKKKLHNRSVDFHDQLEKALDEYEKQYENTLKVRDANLKEASKEDYDGRLDSLIEHETKAIDDYAELISNTKRRKEKIEDYLIQSDSELNDLREDLQKVEADYKLARKSYNELSKDARQLSYFKEREGDRNSIIDMYNRIENETEKSEISQGIVDIYKNYRKNILETVEDKGNLYKGTSNQSDGSREFNNKEEAENSKIIDRIKKERYNPSKI